MAGLRFVVTLQPEKITDIRFVFGSSVLKDYISVTQNFFSGTLFRKLHYMYYSFGIQRITWNISLGVVFLVNLLQLHKRLLLELILL